MVVMREKKKLLSLHDLLRLPALCSSARASLISESKKMENGRKSFLFRILCVFWPFLALRVLAQSQEGFINIDCGYIASLSYVDSSNGLTYTSDSQFVESGDNHMLSSNAFGRWYDTLRSFPDSSRNCYNLSPVESGGKYLIRAGFNYGNYDGKNSTPVFDLHVGVNYWTTVELGSDGGLLTEIIMVSFGEIIKVCLVNTGKGTPFISLLELKPLPKNLYPLATGSESLVLQDRWNYGIEDQLRYPDDPYDRIWYGVTDPFILMSTANPVQVEVGDTFEVPQKVLETAVTYNNISHHMTISPITANPGERVFIVMHFAELLQLGPNKTRVMDIYGGEIQHLLFGNYPPSYLKAEHKEITNGLAGRSGLYNLSIYVTSSSTLSYMINALESYTVKLMNELQTISREVYAMEDIKRGFRVLRNWKGDPCCPRQYAWEGVSCSYDSGIAKIIYLNLSSSGLAGTIPSSIGQLTDLITLDISNNSLKGPIPDTLAALPSLRFLDISGNEALGDIPQSLCERASMGALSISIEDWPSKCKSSLSHKKKIIIPIIVAVFFIILIVLALSFWIFKRKTQARPIGGISNEPNTSHTTKKDGSDRRTENLVFTYEEIKQITQNFRYEIGRGGFGTVYFGNLINGTKVAVKVLSSASSQGNREFEAEVQLLARVHHKNLVTLIGYCDDAQSLSLVYEYMDNGTLRDHLTGKMFNFKTLTWNQRVTIALQAAQGLDYLHNGCTPPIVHRDIKSTNILLNGDFVAKIADFGLSRAFETDSRTHIITKVAGTPGYLDPLELQSHGSSEKSDVYSFGIVLLEILTGQPPYIISSNKIHIVQWVSLLVNTGDIRSIIDPSLQGHFDISVAWKMVEIAMSCTSENTEERIAMSSVVMQLKRCLEMHESQNTIEDASSPCLNDALPYAPHSRPSPSTR